MSEEVNKIFEQWKQFLSWCYENNDKTTEIHRDNLEKVMEYTEKLENQLQQKENTIKEIGEMLYKRDKDDYDIYTANVLCDIQSDFEEILESEVN